MKRLAWLFALTPLILTGCATEALWSTRDFREPTNPPNIEIFQSNDTKRVLVSYDETGDTSEHISRRSYWLIPGEKPKCNPHRPRFVSITQSKDLENILLLNHPLTNSPSLAKLCAFTSTNDIGFTIFSDTQPPTTYRLPVYEDSAGRSKRIFLTPLAVAADATIVGGYLFLWWWSAGNLNDVH